MRILFIVMIMALSISCEKLSDLQSTSSELKDYIQYFKEKKGLDSWSVDVIELNTKRPLHCQWDSVKRQHACYLNSVKWVQLLPNQKIVLVFHEMGHMFIGLIDNEAWEDSCPSSVMSESLYLDIGCLSDKRTSRYIWEL